MRCISVLVVFALNTVVCAVTTINSGVPEAISLQTRSLLGEVHKTRFRSRRTVNGEDNFANHGTSAETSADGGDQAPPSRKRKNARTGKETASTENGGDARSTRGQLNTGTLPKLRRQNGEVDLDHEKTAFSPAALKHSGFSSVSSQKSSLSLGTITLGSSDSWSTILKKALSRDQSSTGTSSTPRRQHSQSDLNHDDDDVGRNPVYSPALFRSGSSSSISSQLSSKKSNTRGTNPKPSKESTDQERQDIAVFLRQRMNAEGSLPPGTIKDAAQHFSRHQRTIERIYKELKPKSFKQRIINEQERQKIVLFLRQRMNAGGSIPRGTISEAAQHFGRRRHKIGEIYKELKPKSANERLTTDQERQDIAVFLRQRMKAGGILPSGTINEAAQHFGRHRVTISQIYKELKSSERYTKNQERQNIALFLRQRMKAGGSLPYGTIHEAAQHFGQRRHKIGEIYKELKPESLVKQRVITDQERQDIALFLRQRMKAGGILPSGTINEAAQHFGRHRVTISQIYKELKSKYAHEHGANIDTKTIIAS
jgi:DNA-binding transcriptional regulator YhcF (GntR family)